MTEDRPRPGIQVLPSLEAVRKRPHMYLGPQRERHADAVLGTVLLDHLQAARLRPVSIVVEVFDDWTFQSSDDGAGIPPLVKSGQYEIDMASELMVGRPCQGQLAVAHAMAEAMTVTSTHDGRKWQRTYGREPTAPWSDLGPATVSGTAVHVTLDRQLLTEGLTDGVLAVPPAELISFFGEWVTGWAMPLLDMASIRFSDARHPDPAEL